MITSINGGFPVAISITVQPRDQMSAWKYKYMPVHHKNYQHNIYTAIQINCPGVQEKYKFGLDK